MLANHDLPRRGEHRWVDELDRIADRGLPRVFALPKGFIAFADLDVPRPKHGRTIADEQTCFACRTLQTLGFLNHLPVHRVGERAHESRVKVGDQ
jgi:hypothetical protein